MSNFLLSVEMQNSSLYMVKSVIVKSVKIAANVFRLGDVADFLHKSSIELLLLNRAQMFHRSTSAAILPNRCYKLPFFCTICPNYFSLVMRSSVNTLFPSSNNFNQEEELFSKFFIVSCPTKTPLLVNK